MQKSIHASKEESVTSNGLYKQQKDAISTLKGNNAILMAPTGAGKTKVLYEQANIKNADTDHSVIITAPTKVLSNERFIELTNQGLNVGLNTGDSKYNTEAPIICCTQEIYNTKYAKRPNQNVIIDEFHYVYDNPDRAYAYMHSIEQTNPTSKIMILSATLPNPEILTKKMEELTNRKFVNYQTDTRTTDLTFVDDMFDINESENSLIFAFSLKACNGIAQEVCETREDSVEGNAAFSIMKKAGINNPQLLEYAKYQVGIYIGNMTPLEKQVTAELYKAGLLTTLIGTDALAVGVNLPAEKVLFAENKYPEKLSESAFMQCSGRAGRKGFYNEGIVGRIKTNSVYSWMPDDDFYALVKAATNKKIKQNENSEISITTTIENVLQDKHCIDILKEIDIRRINDISKNDKEQQEMTDAIRKMIEKRMSYELTNETQYDKNEKLKKLTQSLTEGVFEFTVQNIISFLETYSFDFNDQNATQLSKQQLFERSLNAITETYFSEYSIEQNIANGIAFILAEDHGLYLNLSGLQNAAFKDQVQFVRYAESLPKEYKQFIETTEYEKLKNHILSRDKTALNGKNILETNKFIQNKVSTYKEDQFKQNERQKNNEIRHALIQLKLEKITYKDIKQQYILSNKQIVLEALKHGENVFSNDTPYINRKTFTKDKEISDAAIKIDPCCVKYFTDISKEIALKAIEYGATPMFICKECSEKNTELLKDKEFVNKIIEQEPACIRYIAKDDPLNDVQKTVIHDTLQKHFELVDLMTQDVQTEDFKNIVLDIISSNPMKIGLLKEKEQFQNATDRYTDIALCALKKNVQSIQCMPQQLIDINVATRCGTELKASKFLYTILTDAPETQKYIKTDKTEILGIQKKNELEQLRKFPHHIADIDSSLPFYKELIIETACKEREPEILDYADPKILLDNDVRNAITNEYPNTESVFAQIESKMSEQNIEKEVKSIHQNTDQRDLCF